MGYSIKNAVIGIKDTLITNFLSKVLGSIALSGVFFDPLKLGVAQAILILSVFDVILGSILAYKDHVLTVSQAVKGSAIKLCTYLVLMSTAYIATQHIPGLVFTIPVLNTQVSFSDIMIYFILFSEVISILEVANSLGIPVPFISKLKLLRKKYGELDIEE